VEELVEVVCQINDILRTWAIVEHTFTWFLNNATGPAMRHYLPAWRNIVHSDDHERLGDGDRFREPAGMGVMLPLIRETNTAVAAVQFLRDSPRVPTYGFDVTVPHRSDWTNNVEFDISGRTVVF
jgi:hypothetical protein